MRTTRPVVLSATIAASHNGRKPRPTKATMEVIVPLIRQARFQGNTLRTIAILFNVTQLTVMNHTRDIVHPFRWNRFDQVNRRTGAVA